MSRDGRHGGFLRTLLAAAPIIAGPALAQVAGDVVVGAPQVVAHRVPGPAAPPGELAEPRPLVLPQAVYPRAARAARQEGRVTVCFTVDERGVVRAPAISESSDPLFDAPVLQAIRGARFAPARVGDTPVRSTACRTFRFLLQ